MTVTQVHQSSGSFNIGFRFPGTSWDTIREFGHIVIVPKGDAASLANSIYTGVVLKRVRTDKGWAIVGKGMDFWLGDGVQYGEVLEPPKLLNTNYWEGAGFTTVINTLLPQALTAGTISGTGLTALYYNEHVWDTPINAIRYVLDAYAAIHDTDVEYRVNQDGTIDVGKKTGIYVTTPTAVITRRKTSTAGHTSHGGNRFSESMDANDYATRAVLQAQGAGYTLKVGEADLVDIGETNAYKDVQGNVLKRVKVVSEPETPQYSDNPNYLPDYRAQLHLKVSQKLGQRVRINGAEWDLEDIGSFAVGDMVWVYNDEDSDWKDGTNPISYDGGTIYPVAKRVFKKTWPVHNGAYDIYYRDKDGIFTNLTSYLVNEKNTKGSVEIGDSGRNLAYNPDLLKNVYLDRASHNPDTNNDPGGQVDDDGATTIPAQVAWASTPWGYNSWIDEKGERKIEILVQWAEPLNTNGNAITDGDRYELERKRSTDANWRPATIIGWGSLSRLVSGLESTPSSGWTWEFRIRAVDNAGNAGAWSTTESIASIDNVPPSQPSVPVVTVLPLTFKMVHDGTKNGGGDLEGDTQFLRFFVGTSAGFTADNATQVSRVPLRAGGQTSSYVDVSSHGDGTTLYVKVIAEDWVGNLSPVSPEASDDVVVITTTVITDEAITTPKVAANAITAAKIEANTITAGEIAANTITAGEIAAAAIKTDELDASSVTAAKIAIGTITADRLILGSSDNLIQNPGWEDSDFDTGSDPHDYAEGTGGAWSRATSNKRSGGVSAKYEVNSQASAASVVLNGLKTDINAHPAASEGDVFHFEVWTKYTIAAPTSTTTLRISWRDETGTEISVTSSAGFTQTNNWAKKTFGATAPAGTAYVVFFIRIGSGSGSTVNLFFDDCYARRKVGTLVIEGQAVDIERMLDPVFADTGWVRNTSQTWTSTTGVKATDTIVVPSWVGELAVLATCQAHTLSDSSMSWRTWLKIGGTTGDIIWDSIVASSVYSHVPAASARTITAPGSSIVVETFGGLSSGTETGITIHQQYIATGLR